MDAAKLLDDVTGRVRAALDEAEEKAREIVSSAEERASELIASAETEAEEIRGRAESESQERLAQVREALASLEGAIGLEGPKSEIDPGPAEVPEPMPPVEPEPSPPAEPEPMPPEPEIEPPAPAEPDRQSPQLKNGFGSERSHDATAARIIAMKMALDGSERDAISSHLDENYEIENNEKLLDDVMARAKR